MLRYDCTCALWHRTACCLFYRFDMMMKRSVWFVNLWNWPRSSVDLIFPRHGNSSLPTDKLFPPVTHQSSSPHNRQTRRTRNSKPFCYVLVYIAKHCLYGHTTCTFTHLLVRFLLLTMLAIAHAKFVRIYYRYGG